MKNLRYKPLVKLSKFEIFKKKKLIFLLTFFFFFLLVFISYKSLFNSYFEGDEWVGFTLTLPLTNDSLGFLKSLFQEGGDSAKLVQSQHIVPVSRGTFFLNTLFFGTNFFPYAFIALTLHAINSFLVFLLIRLLLPRKFSFAFLGGLFFALSPVHMHAVTWAATFPTNNLPVTLSLASIIFFKLGFVKREKKFIYASLIILFLALAAKETAFILFAILPLMALFEKKTFSKKFLIIILSSALLLYLTMRFLLPGIYSLQTPSTTEIKQEDTKTIVSRDISIHENIVAELISRAITFPIRMTGTTFIPRKTLTAIVTAATPYLSPVEPGGNTVGQGAFLYGSGNFVFIYLVGLTVIIYCLFSTIKFIRKRQMSEAQALTLGIALIILTAMPLVVIVLSFPRWGYDFYFDSRYYYSASIGGAIVFPFIIYSIAYAMSRNFKMIKYSIAFVLITVLWLIQNMYFFNLTLPELTANYRPDRRAVVQQLKGYLPTLPEKAVFYIETDGNSPYGAKLPFDTSVAQALTVVYYDKNHLPDSFFKKPLFSGEPHGYQFDQGRGFGYFTSKKELANAATTSGSFSIDNIYGFYYYAKDIRLKNTTTEIRKEIKDIIQKDEQ